VSLFFFFLGSAFYLPRVMCKNAIKVISGCDN
jgi:hypothetical protein